MVFEKIMASSFPEIINKMINYNKQHQSHQTEFQTPIKMKNTNKWYTVVKRQ